jgi:hypothetical protein
MSLEACSTCVFPYFIFHMENFQDLRLLDLENGKVNSNAAIPIAVLSRAQVCCRLIVGIAGSIPAEGIDVPILRLLCVV